MIDWTRSAEINCMSVDDLRSCFDRFPHSSKKIVAVCDTCDKERIIELWTYKDLCKSCAMAGHEVSEVTRQRISKSHKGMKASDEAKAKMSESAKNRPPISDETRKKIGKFHKGNTYNVGRTASEETKKMMSKSSKGKHVSDHTRELISNTLMGHDVSHETRIKMSCGLQGIEIEDFNGFVGRHNKDRHYVLPEGQCLKINERLKWSHAHHISADVIVYIPNELHRHIYHSMKNGVGMYEMNMLSLQYVKGDI